MNETEMGSISKGGVHFPHATTLCYVMGVPYEAKETFSFLDVAGSAIPSRWMRLQAGRQ
jgi:hypothetical protein